MWNSDLAASRLSPDDLDGIMADDDELDIPDDSYVDGRSSRDGAAGQSDGAAHEASHTQPASGASANASLNKACEGCRQSKLRCIVEDASPEGICKRCLSTGRECVFKAPRARQRRKIHVDARVAELERQLRTLRMQLDQAQQQRPPDRVSASAATAGATAAGATPSPPPQLRFEAPVTPATWPRKSESLTTDLLPYHDDRPKSLTNPSPALRLPPNTGTTEDDVVARGVVSWEDAEQLVKVYREFFATLYPFVTLPGFTNADALRRQRPATFLAIVAAASVTHSAELNKALNHELLLMVARRTMLEGDHDLDLVQAMIVMTIWYAPLDRFENLRHYQYAHLAAGIAADIGLGSKSRNPEEKISLQEDMDRCRTLLSIYLLCTGISTTTGRSNMLRFDSTKQDCINRLKAQAQVSATDRWFVAWVELQRMTELAGERFFSSRPLDISEVQNQIRVTDFVAQLEKWKQSLGFDLGAALEVHYRYARIIVLCTVLYVNHEVEDFRPPFRVRPIGHPIAPSPPVTPFLTSTIWKLIEDIHAALSAFLSFNEEALLAAPMVYYVRTCHALTVLLILDIDCRRAGSDLINVIDPAVLKVQHYFALLKQHLQRQSCFKSSAKFLLLIEKMERWWLAQGTSPASSTLGSPELDLQPFFSAKDLADDQARLDSLRNNVALASANAVPPQPSSVMTAVDTPVLVQPLPLTQPVVHPPAHLMPPVVLANGVVMPIEQQDMLLENWVLDHEHQQYSAAFLPPTTTMAANTMIAPEWFMAHPPLQMSQMQAHPQYPG